MTAYSGEKGYLQLLKDTLENGEKRECRNGNVFSSFAKVVSFNDIEKNFPLLTSKKMFTRGVIEELLWFLRGSTDAKELQEKKVNIWNGNSTREYLDSVGLKHYKEGETAQMKAQKEEENRIKKIKHLESLSPRRIKRRMKNGRWPEELAASKVES